MKKQAREGGRPPKSAGRVWPVEEVDQLLVHGEIVECASGNGHTVNYPSYRELAERFGISDSVIAKYSKDHNCLNRRRAEVERVRVQADQHLTRLRAQSIAITKEETVRIIDRYTEEFLKALDEGRVRTDNPADFNTMIRLKEFMMGGPDSRTEVHAKLTLDTLQERHRQMMQVVAVAPEVRGELPRSESRSPPSRGAHRAPQNPGARSGAPDPGDAEEAVGPDPAPDDPAPGDPGDPARDGPGEGDTAADSAPGEVEDDEGPGTARGDTRRTCAKCL